MSRLLTLLFLGSSLFAQEEIKVPSTLKHLQIFQPGATLYREAQLQLKPGQHDLVFTDLSIGLDPNTIQVFSDNDLEVISFKVSNIPFTDREKPQEYLSLEEKLEENKTKIAEIDAELEALKIEKALIEENKKIGGSNGYTMQELKAISDYAKNQILANSKKVFELSKKKEALIMSNKDLTNELNTLRQKMNQLQSAIVVRVRNQASVKANLGLSYSYRNNISWDPVYRLEFSDLDKALEIEQLASIYQNTGEDLKDVEISLSTGSPSLNNQLPRLQTNFINLYTPRPDTYSSSPEPAMARDMAYVEGVKASVRKLSSTRMKSTVTMETRQDFELKGRYTLTNAKRETLGLQTYKLDADYHYESVPKLETAVYLMANLRNYESYQLIPGQVSIFNQGAYNGSFYTDFKSSEEGLDISLGQDPSFNISYERVFNEERESFFGGTKVEFYHYRINLKPAKTKGLKLILKDHIPISQNNDLKVKLIERQNAQFDEETGFLTWTIDLQNPDSKQIDFKYELRYPSDQKIN